MPAIWRTFEAQAAHSLPLVEDGHKCKKLHGHNFKVTVRVQSDELVDGMVIDYSVLDSIWNERIKRRFDHGTVNEWIENPTSEEIARRVFAVFADALTEMRFDKKLPDHQRLGVEQVEVMENERSGAVWP
jgi:6-pyruvoyltetrahydropterin/6-carboxytetrahydropterin synthase